MEKYDPNRLYFLTCQNDKEAELELYEYFESNCLKYTASVLSGFRTTLRTEDFEGFIGELFVESVNTYDPSSSSFVTFLHKCVFIRLRNKVRFEIANQMLYSYNLYDDDNDNEPNTSVENCEDKSLKDMSTEILNNDLRLMMSSPLHKGNILTRLTRKIMILTYGGFNQKEICDYLKISKSKYYSIIKKAQKNIETTSFQLEMK